MTDDEFFRKIGGVGVALGERGKSLGGRGVVKNRAHPWNKFG